jgi:hypothetical protein
MTLAKRKRASSPLVKTSTRSKILKALDGSDGSDTRDEFPPDGSGPPSSNSSSEAQTKDGDESNPANSQLTAAGEFGDEGTQTPDEVFIDING